MPHRRSHGCGLCGAMVAARRPHRTNGPTAMTVRPDCLAPFGRRCGDQVREPNLRPGTWNPALELRARTHPSGSEPGAARARRPRPGGVRAGAPGLSGRRAAWRIASGFGPAEAMTGSGWLGRGSECGPSYAPGPRHDPPPRRASTGSNRGTGPRHAAATERLTALFGAARMPRNLRSIKGLNRFDGFLKFAG